ncbi:MAG: CAP domain-containing protein [Bacteroidales bacterium]|nr:CAP domain-containing protein [Bacteroidales bacterium]
MIYLHIILLASFLFPGKSLNNISDSTYKSHCITQKEMSLYVLINNYREERGLPSIPLSKSLSFVARQHVIDLQNNVKHLTHGWSTCEYKTQDRNTFDCMWLKPRELTDYEGYGYECAYMTSANIILPENVLNTWKSSAPHNSVIVNRGQWTRHRWNALGVGIFGNYAVIWFGEEADTEETPIVCD